MRGGKKARCGTPQGGVVSPLLANLYLNRYLKHWRQQGKGKAPRAEIVTYADDFVILSRGHGAEALSWTRGVMERIGLTLNEAKTRLVDPRAHHSQGQRRRIEYVEPVGQAFLPQLIGIQDVTESCGHSHQDWT